MIIDVNDPTSIKDFLDTCSKEPGIYKMLSNTDEVLYVGKAKNLAKRLANYFVKINKSPKVTALVKQICSISTTITNTEAEALILECNLIKQYRPKYNVLLRDDKSYPYICVSKHVYSRLYIHRGKKPDNAVCFGPYPNVYAAKQTIRLLQQVFLIRTCTDNYFNNRTRPCLLYQIKRCSAPCVDYIKPPDYGISIADVKLFLDGKSKELIKNFISKMEEASIQQNYELAASIRDQIKKLQEVAEQQYVEIDTKDSQKPIDVIGIESAQGLLAIVILKFRNGRLLGSHEFLNKIPLWSQDEDEKTVLDDVVLSILSQYYLDFTDNMPQEIILNYNINKFLLTELISSKYSSAVKLLYNPKGAKNKWLALALKNVHEILTKKQNSNNIYANQFHELKQVLNLSDIPNSIECFDVSHTFGEQTIASCIVFEQSGAQKSAYRRYNISQAIKGDDIAAMKEVLLRRYKKLVDNNSIDKLPSIVLIDGGKAQINAAKQIFMDLGIENQLIYGITKGEGRLAINDRIISSVTMQEVIMPSKSEARRLLQQMRDEAHRFALMGHRAKRDKEQMHSILEDIPGVGAKRRKKLLACLGGIQEIKQVSMEQLANVPGISKQLAEVIYNYLHK
jgi:excinuclease ABC subunit C